MTLLDSCWVNDLPSIVQPGLVFTSALPGREGWEELKELRDKWHLINQSTPLSLLWETKGQHFRTLCYDQSRSHSPCSLSAPKVLPLEQHNSHPSSQWFTQSVPQFTWEGLQGNCSACEVGLAALDANANGIQQRLKTGIKQCKQMSFPLQKELSSGKAFLLPWIRLPRDSTAFLPTEAQTDVV